MAVRDGCHVRSIWRKPNKKRRKDMKKRRLTITAFLLCVVLALGIGFATTTGNLFANGKITYHGSEAVTSSVYFSRKADGQYSTVTFVAPQEGSRVTEATITSVFDTASVLTEGKCTDEVSIAVSYDSGNTIENTTLPNIKITVTAGPEEDVESRMTVVVTPNVAEGVDPANLKAGSTVNYLVKLTFDPSNPTVVNGTYKCTYKISFAYELA